MKKLLAILFLGLLCFNISLADSNEIKKMMKSENYNLGIKKNDSTIKGIKLKPILNEQAYKNAVKNNYGWLDYGLKVVYSKDGEPIRYGDTALRFELHYDDCGFTFLDGKYRDCIRNPPHHRFEVGQGYNKTSKGFSHRQEYWYTVSFYLDKNHKFFRKQSVFQFHSSEEPYQPPLQIEILPKDGLAVKIATSEGVYADKDNACGVGMKAKVNYCEKASIKYIVMNPDELENSLGKWTDFIIHAVWDKRASGHEKNKGLFEIFINGKKKVHYEGQTMWNIGRSVMQFGIYQSKDARIFKDKKPTIKEMKANPTIAFYDEIWAKKKCKDLRLGRLGYSCEYLKSQSNEIIKPDYVERTKMFASTDQASSASMDGQYKLFWFWINRKIEGNEIVMNNLLFSDQVTIAKGKLTFDKLTNSKIISDKYRDKITFINLGDSFILQGNLDLDTSGTKKVIIAGSTTPDERGFYIGEGLFGIDAKKGNKEFIKVKLVPTNEKEETSTTNKIEETSTTNKIEETLVAEIEVNLDPVLEQLIKLTNNEINRQRSLVNSPIAQNPAVKKNELDARNDRLHDLQNLVKKLASTKGGEVTRINKLIKKTQNELSQAAWFLGGLSSRLRTTLKNNDEITAIEFMRILDNEVESNQLIYDQLVDILGKENLNHRHAATLEDLGIHENVVGFGKLYGRLRAELSADKNKD